MIQWAYKFTANRVADSTKELSIAKTASQPEILKNVHFQINEHSALLMSILMAGDTNKENVTQERQD